MTHPLAYAVLAGGVAACFAVDLLVVSRRSSGGNPSIRRAALDYAAWTLLGLAVTLPMALTEGGHDATSYVTVFVLEKTLSLDNVAVIAAVLTGFAVAERDREKLLEQGIVGALLLRILFIAAGVALLDAARPILIPAGLLLVYTGVKMLRKHEPEPGAAPKPPPGSKILGRIPGLAKRPTLAPLIALVVADAVFAVDSVPAAFGVTTKPLVVIAANAFAILGLRPTYQLLNGGLDRFPLLEPAVAVLLMLLGLKLALDEVVHIPDVASLLVVFAVIGSGIGLSLLKERREAASG